MAEPKYHETTRPLLQSERPARRALGDIGHTLFWGMIRDGVLDVRRIGRRTFVTTESVERVAANAAPGCRSNNVPTAA